MWRGPTWPSQLDPSYFANKVHNNKHPKTGSKHQMASSAQSICPNTKHRPCYEGLSLSVATVQTSCFTDGRELYFFKNSLASNVWNYYFETPLQGLLFSEKSIQSKSDLSKAECVYSVFLIRPGQIFSTYGLISVPEFTLYLVHSHFLFILQQSKLLLLFLADIMKRKTYQQYKLKLCDFHLVTET